MASVGFRTVAVPDPREDKPISVAILYPTEAAGEPTAFGPFTLEVARGAEIRDGRFRLVLISHGMGGSPMTHRLLARHLAASGFVVALVEHSFDNRNDTSRTGTVRALSDRPHQLRTVADWFLQGSGFQSRLAGETFAVIGHSLGGYSALALAGGIAASLPDEEPDGQPRRIDTVQDPRVAALVLLAPATPWFRESGSLAGVDVPILLLAGGKDPHCPPALMAEPLLSAVARPERVRYRLIDDAGHYSFLSPWPPAMRNPGFPPSQDPPGFDRDSFMEVLQAEVLDFLAETL